MLRCGACSSALVGAVVACGSRMGCCSRVGRSEVSVDRPAVRASRGVTVEGVRDPRVFAGVVAEAYAHRGVSVEAAFALLANPRLLTAVGKHMLVALVDAEPVASALGFIDGPVGVLSWIGTVPHARGRGIAKLITAAAVDRAMAHGARIVGLQATEEGEPLYRQLGFREATRYVRYVVEPPITPVAPLSSQG